MCTILHLITGQRDIETHMFDHAGREQFTKGLETSHLMLLKTYLCIQRNNDESEMIEQDYKNIHL